MTNNFGHAFYKEKLSDAVHCEFKTTPYAMYNSEQTCQILPITSYISDQVKQWASNWLSIAYNT